MLMNKVEVCREPGLQIPESVNFSEKNNVQDKTSPPLSECPHTKLAKQKKERTTKVDPCHTSRNNLLAFILIRKEKKPNIIVTWFWQEGLYGRKVKDFFSFILFILQNIYGNQSMFKTQIAYKTEL